MDSAGRVLINSILPPDIQASKELDSKEIRSLLSKLAVKYPEKFPEISIKLSNLGADFAYRHPKSSLDWNELSPTYELDSLRKAIETSVNQIISDQRLPWKEKEKRILNILFKYDDEFLNKTKEILETRKGSLYGQLASGARGKLVDLRRILTGDVIYIDHRNRPIAVPITNGYSRGLTPAQYWMATFGARKAYVTTNLGTASAGYLSKQLTNAAHRLIVTTVDYPKSGFTPIGLPVDINDSDSVGSFLAEDIGPYKRNTIITPEILADLRNKGHKQILVRSVLAHSYTGPGVASRDVGLFENNRLLSPGDMIGIITSQSLGEPVTQMVIGAKHSGGTSKTKIDISTLIQAMQVPKAYAGAIHSDFTGKVTNIEDAPAGGAFVYVDGHKHYVPPHEQVTVKMGDFIEAGDPLSTGIPNPYKLVQHKGLGEGRRLYVELLRDIYRQTGFTIQRRNFEVLVAGLVDHVKFTAPYENYLPGDVVNYSWLVSRYVPRETSRWVAVDKAVGKYLEKPVLHFTLGTRIAPSMVNMLKQFGVTQILVNDEPLPFESHMVPAAKVLDYDPDWLVRFLGGTVGQKKSLLKAVQEGHKSDIMSTSYVPSFVTGKTFAKEWPEKIIKVSV